jgi:hypothetical protein
MLFSLTVLVGFLAVVCTPGLVAESRANARARKAEGEA